MKEIIKYSLIVIGSLSVIVMGTSAVNAYRGNSMSYGPYHTEAREALMDVILQKKDYKGWVEIMTENDRNPRIVEIINTEKEFEKFIEMRNLMKSGKQDEANEIREELGLGNGERNHYNFRVHND